MHKKSLKMRQTQFLDEIIRELKDVAADLKIGLRISKSGQGYKASYYKTPACFTRDLFDNMHICENALPRLSFSGFEPSASIVHIKWMRGQYLVNCHAGQKNWKSKLKKTITRHLQNSLRQAQYGQRFIP